MDLHEKLIEFGYSQELYQQLIDEAYTKICIQAPSNPTTDYILTSRLRDPLESGYASIGLWKHRYLILILRFRKEYSGLVGANVWKLVDYDIGEDIEKGRSYKSLSGKNLRAAVDSI